MNEKIEDKQLYEYFFHEARFPIIEKVLSPENVQKFREASNEDKALFINDFHINNWYTFKNLHKNLSQNLRIEWLQIGIGELCYERTSFCRTFYEFCWRWHKEGISTVFSCVEANLLRNYTKRCLAR